MRKWIYTASFGTLEIVELSATQFEARYNSEPGNIYDSPSAAADDFFTHHTGCDLWDSSDFCISDSLSEWTLLNF